MRLSRHNILIASRNTGKTYLINLLSGHADMLDPPEAEQIRNGWLPQNPDFAEKGYVVDEAEEITRYREAYLNFLDGRERMRATFPVPIVTSRVTTTSMGAWLKRSPMLFSPM
jgi:hypothetical protein